MAEEVVQQLPSDEVGKCVLARVGGLYGGDAESVVGALERGELLFHEGSIRGALPRIVRG